MHRYFLQLAYNGTNYHGWQRQDNANTIQEEIESKLQQVYQSKIDITGCGRTDTGVHASEYFAHVDFNEEVNDFELKHKLNTMLSPDIAIHKISKVNIDAHARFDAISRSYVYKITTEKNPFLVNLAYHYRKPLDIDLMNHCAKELLHLKDFKSFCKEGSDNKTTICNVTNAVWKADGNSIQFYITADRFLRNMVRAIVGTLLLVGVKKINKKEFVDIAISGNRSRAGSSAPASGLYLDKIVYPKNLFLS